MAMAEVPNLMPALPEIFLALAAMALLMLGVFQRTATPDGVVQASRLTSGLGLLSLVLALILVFAVSGASTTTFGGLFVGDAFITFSKVLILVASGFSLILAQNWLEKQDAHRFEFAVLILFATLGMMMMVAAGNMMSLYMGLELQSLSLYVLAAFHRDDARATEAGLKYFVLGALASGLLLYGISLVYGYSGTMDFTVIASVLKGGAPAGLVVGLVFVMAGLAFKVSAVPFHMWTPDVYEGAPTPVTAFFSVAPKVAALVLFMRVMEGPFGDLSAQWQQIVIVMSILSMLVGSFGAVAQTNIKRMMAYSSISHVGYALIGLAVANVSGTAGLLVYLSIYIVMNIGTFACIISMRKGGRAVENISELSGLSKTHPAMAAALAVFMFSMAGIPPLAGFFAKLYILLAALKAGFYVLAVIGVLASVVSAYFYLRIIKVMYFDEPGVEPLDSPVPASISAVMAVTSAAIILFVIFPNPLIRAAESAAAALF